MQGYSEAFFAALDTTSEPSARAVLPILLELHPVESAVDVGCGDGSWLRVLQQLSGCKVFGLDGPWHSGTHLKISAGDFRRLPLDQPFHLNRTFDLAICLEVAEHLPRERAGDFVSELCKLAPMVLFSAAIPGQGGVNHFNEQWPEYWASRFADHGMVALDLFRLRLWNDQTVAWWYKQNTVLYVSPSILEKIVHSAPHVGPAPALPALVHPDAWNQARRQGEPGLGRWLRMAPAALRRSLAKLRRTDRRKHG